jgi:hypothetical protein
LEIEQNGQVDFVESIHDRESESSRYVRMSIGGRESRTSIEFGKMLRNTSGIPGSQKPINSIRDMRF